MCFENTGLRRRLEDIRPEFGEGRCSTHPRRIGLPVDKVTAIIDEVFRNNFDHGGLKSDFGETGDSNWSGYRTPGKSFQDVVEALTQPVSDKILITVCDQLIEDDFYWPPDGEEAFYDEDMNYVRVSHGDEGHAALWEQFCESVTYNQRFFNDDARGFLAEIFKNIHLQRDSTQLYPVYWLNPLSESPTIYRARIVEEKEIKAVYEDPAGQLGPPPRGLGKPNRMNPSGITALYGAFDKSTCVSELRPLVGSKVAIAEFRFKTKLCILDMTRFSAPTKELNLFAKDHTRRLSQWRFMQRFMTEMSKPISPTDEHINYVPTQIVAGYLNKIHEVEIGREKTKIDAIIFASAQRPKGKNIVVLGNAASISSTAQRGRSIKPSSGLGEMFSASVKDEQALEYVDDSLEIREISSASFSSKKLYSYHIKQFNEN